MEKETKYRVKLYKSGKFWLAAGITTVTLGMGAVVGPKNASADVTAQAEKDSTQQTVTVDTTVATTSNQSASTYTLKSTTSDAASGSTASSSANSSASASSVTTTDKAAVSESTSSAATSSAASGQAAAQKTTADSATALSSASDSTTAASATPSAKVIVTDDPTSAKTAAKTTYAQTGQAQQLTFADPTDDSATTVDSGTYGTSAWTLDSDGVLTIGTGEISGTDVPWTTDADKITSIIATDPIKLDSGNGTFANLPNVTTIDLSGLDTSAVTDMSSMFENDPKLVSVVLTSFNTSNVTTMVNMFANDTALQSLDLSNLDMSKVPTATGMSGMLANTTSLWKLTLSPTNKLVNSDLPDVPVSGTELPDGGNVVADNGTGPEQTGWQELGDGTDHTPDGALQLSDQFVAYYTGNNDSTGNVTYVWSQPTTMYIQYVDVATGENVPKTTDKVPNKTDNPYFTAISTPDWPLYQDTDIQDYADGGILPKGYHVPTTDELGSYVQPDLSTPQGPDGTIVYMYVAEDAPTVAKSTVTKTIHYQDASGKMLAPDYTDSVTITSSTDAATGDVTYTPTDAKLGSQPNPTISGYEVTTSPAGATEDSPVAFGDSNITLTVVYSPVSTGGSGSTGTSMPATTTTTLTVQYVDQNGASIAPNSTQTGTTSTQFTVSAPTIAGYELADPTQQTVTGTYQNSAMTLTFVYNKDADTSSSSASDAVSSSQSSTNGNGTSTNGNGTSISGANGSTNAGNSNSTGTFGSNGQSSATSFASGVNPRANGLATNDANQAAKTSSKTLPQTGEANSASLLSLIGMSLLTALGFGIKKRKDEEAK